MQGKCQKTKPLARRANIPGGERGGHGTTSKREEDSVQKLAESEFHLQHHYTASKKKKGNEAIGDHGQKQSWREGAAQGRRCCRLAAGIRDTGFLPTDLELCLFHKTPFLGRDAGTGESGFDRLN